MSDVELDASGLEVLPREDCVALLRGQAVGRVVFTSAALPAVLPVNYLVDGDDAILLRTSARTRLASTVGAVVAFEVDDLSGPDTAWSVVVTGRLSIVRDREERARIDALDLRSWLPDERDVVLRIEPELVSGRRLPRPVDSYGAQTG
jgi:nitroimidazol reductase NimA-like FMN-containing flavoprotein (pyridoxamine 5'-phosphate oxidase superfamily)